MRLSSIPTEWVGTTHDFKRFKIVTNPTASQIDEMLASLNPRGKDIGGIINKITGDMDIWDRHLAAHSQVMEQLNLRIGDVVCFYIGSDGNVDVSGSYVNKDANERLFYAHPVIRKWFASR